ncbi:hypothetical protein ACM66B_004408 [Microbotryomycetes sp. NB124-2]
MAGASAGRPALENIGGTSAPGDSIGSLTSRMQNAIAEKFAWEAKYCALERKYDELQRDHQRFVAAHEKSAQEHKNEVERVKGQMHSYEARHEEDQAAIARLNSLVDHTNQNFQILQAQVQSWSSRVSEETLLEQQSRTARDDKKRADGLAADLKKCQLADARQQEELRAKDERNESLQTIILSQQSTIKSQQESIKNLPAKLTSESSNGAEAGTRYVKVTRAHADA